MTKDVTFVMIIVQIVNNSVINTAKDIHGGRVTMRKGVLRVTACCLAGTMMFAGNGVVTMASGFDMPLAGLESRIQQPEEKKEAAGGTIQVKATGYDVKAIAQVDEYVNIRDAAGENGAVIGQIYNNSAADILGQEGDWYLVKSGDVTGYVKSEFFATGE